MAQVIFPFELGEQHRGRLSQHVHQHIEAAAVGHADDDSSTPKAPDCWMMSSMRGMNDSPPSSEKRF